MFTVHFTDHYGQGSIDCKTKRQAQELKAKLEEDADNEDIWIEDERED